MINKLVDLMAYHVDDAVPVAEVEIQNFARQHKIPLREDHLHFLMRYGSNSGARLKIFKNYGGDFDFASFKRVYIEDYPEMKVPDEYAYFGSSFMDLSFCIHYESGKIYSYEEGEIYGVVHESINGFLMSCLLGDPDSFGKFFSSVLVDRDLNIDDVNNFKLKYEKEKLNELTRYTGESENSTISEYYFSEGKLIYLYLPTKIMRRLGGGILNALSH
ncbi:SMI1/KNR4 family protein [Massilia sp. P8910]|uniref:SMI1/KNR4 family protein n=1 Tax=Massilia antarctica TaxID=2765360 RepID=UPI001E5D7FC3|nr:SMI1/KNR4 family protein [Massilia antarctica]MCE3602568.1 SMI1/KNR4 family protein [Massilia antarctica]